MKKLGFLFFLIVLVCGCGRQEKLTCTYDYQTKDPTGEIEFQFLYDSSGKTLEKYYTITTITYEEDDSVLAEDYEEYQKHCQQYQELSGIQCSVTKENHTLIVEETLTLSQLDEESKKEFAIEELEGRTMSSLRTMMEETGFTCQ